MKNVAIGYLCRLYVSVHISSLQQHSAEYAVCVCVRV